MRTLKAAILAADNSAETQLAVRAAVQMYREENNWVLWTAMWDPAQRDRFVDLTGIDHAPRCTLQRVRSALTKINRLMTVVTTALFARRLEQDYIDRVTEQRVRDQDQRPAPPQKSSREDSSSENTREYLGWVRKPGL